MCMQMMPDGNGICRICRSEFLDSFCDHGGEDKAVRLIEAYILNLILLKSNEINQFRTQLFKYSRLRISYNDMNQFMT